MELLGAFQPHPLFPILTLSLKQGQIVLPIMPWAASKNLCLEAVGPRNPERAPFRLLSMPELKVLAPLGGRLEQGLGAAVHLQVPTFCRDRSTAVRENHPGPSRWHCAACWDCRRSGRPCLPPRGAHCQAGKKRN